MLHAGLVLSRNRLDDQINRELRADGADHPYVPLLLTVPGIGWVLAFTIAAEIGDIGAFRRRRSSAATPGSVRA
jgi:transposase